MNLHLLIAKKAIMILFRSAAIFKIGLDFFKYLSIQKKISESLLVLRNIISHLKIFMKLHTFIDINVNLMILRK